MTYESGWTLLSESDEKEIAFRLGKLPTEARAVHRKALPFYENCNLYRLSLTADDGSDPRRFYWFLYGEDAIELTGSSKPIHWMNQVQKLDLQPENAPAYLDMFLFFVHGEAGPFIKVESIREFQLPKGSPDDYPEVLKRIRAHVHPAQLETSSAKETPICFKANVVHVDTLFECLLTVATNGHVDMTDDQPLVKDIPQELLPKWHRLNSLDALLASKRPRSDAPLSLDRQLYQTFVEILLEHALSQESNAALVKRYMLELPGQPPLQKFTHFVFSNWPVIALQSDLPFSEELLAESIAGMQRRTPANVTQGVVDETDDSRVRVHVPASDGGLVTFSMHAYRTVRDAERVAHDLSTRAVAALIGCQRIEDLPEPLRRVVDIKLAMPEVNADLFEMIFERLIGAKLPKDWKEGESGGWARYVMHFDFQQPVRTAMPPADALEFIKARVFDRLHETDPRQGPSLAELHGIGEAKIIANDLIADLRAAMSGRISWAEVDRGILLAGAPGTGKTTLARAIAKDCGVRFIAASASSWQGAGHLGDHIRAIRASFREARRYAPSILFIDEIDSVGSRELFSGPNAAYQTDVVNALLEQMQGIDEQAPVVVIAATNFVEKVDPALRRAGRLDRTVVIPYPNVDGLAAIFEYHLRNHRTAGNLATDIVPRELGALAFGLTGADVESFVRGASRRARKLERPITHADLVAEITGSSRNSDGARRLTAQEMHRVAIHEAGHALSRCLSSSKGEDITYISIVPRSNGTLGFVALFPTDNVMLTRGEYLERLDIALAGRAAEEIAFGEGYVSSGSGGESEASDLAVATRIANGFVCFYGFGASEGLRWSKDMSQDRLREVSQLLHTRFELIKAKLEQGKSTLQKLADHLVEHQELSGRQVREMIGRFDV